MKQIIQSYRDGEIWLADVPAPAARDHGVLVNTAASVVSAGTEKMITDLARMSLVGKAQARPDLVRKVLFKVKTEGLFRTWQKVSSKLDTPVTLGYSCSGTIIEVGRYVSGLEYGDRVACGGAGYATHAECNFVPKNLCVKIPPEVSFEDAAFTTLGAIALQGIRQAEVRLGERITVLGLGMLGLLTVQMLKACGCRVLGSDPDTERCRLAVELGADQATANDILSAAEAFSEGVGVDGVIITAATPSNEPIETAAEIARLRGRVVAVGLVGMKVPRDAYYKKELDLRLSRSYGPGRYDPEYEERGRDYPLPYVRWTEKRNMQAFLELIAEGRVTPSKLVTHHFPLDGALKAYELFGGKNSADEQNKYLGIIIDYPGARTAPMPLRTIRLKPSGGSAGVGVGFLGAGNFAKGVLLPIVRGRKDVNLVGLCTASGISAEESGRKFGFSYATTDYSRLLGDSRVSAVCIATRHDGHASQVCDALRAGKHVFVEKPLAITPEGLDEVERAYLSLATPPGHAGEDTPVKDESMPALLVGYNRRFSRHAQAIRDVFAERRTPMLVTYRVNGGAIPKESWIQDFEEGGGRILGEVCHFVDWCEYVTDSPITSVFAKCITPHDERVIPEDSVVITLHHQDGSLSTIQYVALGHSDLPKERAEVFADGKIAVMDDFRQTTFFGTDASSVHGRQDKGFDQELAAFVNAIQKGGEPPIAFDSLIRTSRVTFGIIESLKTGKMVEIVVASAL